MVERREGRKGKFGTISGFDQQVSHTNQTSGKSIPGSKITGSKLSGPVCKKDPKTGESECDLILCEDPKTGQIIVRPRGRCPKGYVEKIAKKMESQDEIIFKVGKSIIVDYDEDQDELVYEGEDEEVEEDEGNEP